MDAASSDPTSDSLVTLVYNVQDDNYYNCDENSYTAGYFAPDYATSVGMNVIVLDAFDWANRVGADPATAPWRRRRHRATTAPSCTRASSPTSSSTC